MAKPRNLSVRRSRDPSTTARKRFEDSAGEMSVSVLDLLSEARDADLAELCTSQTVDLMAFCRSVVRGELGSALTLTPTGEVDFASRPVLTRSEEHTSELQSLMRISYAVFCLK